jgi:CotH kinase protein
MKNIFLSALLLLGATNMWAQIPERSLFDKKTIGDIRVTSPQNNWAEALDSMRLYGTNTLDISLQVDGKSYSSAGMRFRGNSSYQYGMKRNPFLFKLNTTDKDQNHQGHTSIKLSSALRDPSMIREMLFFEIAGQYMPTPKAAYAKLFVNNAYMGIYVVVESVDQKFLTEAFGPNRLAHLYQAGVDQKTNQMPSGCLENIAGSLEHEQNIACLSQNFEIASESTDYVPLHALTYALNNDPKNIKQILDVDRTLWLLALNNVMVNLSSYTGKPGTNYYLYQDQHGKFQPICWDLNLAFGSYKNIGSGSDLELKDLQRMDPLLHAENPYKPLISKLLADPLQKKIYLSHMRQILQDHFLNGQYEQRARELQGLIVVPYSEDTNKPYPLDQFQTSLSTTIGKKTKIPGIIELMSKRTKFLKSHPEMSAIPSVVSDIQFEKREKYEKQKVDAFKISLKADKYPKRTILYYRFDDRDEYKTLTLSDGPQVANLGGGMRAFEGMIPSPTDKSIMQYYLLIENSGAVAFSPTNYTTKQHVISMGEINK